LITKSALSKEDFDTFENVLLGQVEIIAEDELKPYVTAASRLIADEKDLLYIAAALCTGSVIVSNDKDLQWQKRVKVYTIEQLARELKII
ncbi:MAG: hypothetical protein HZA83_00745, partial [Thaumarchaeota archaeon]|nr:hypothetical protein [Nitrososphaerota archaeon]